MLSEPPHRPTAPDPHHRQPTPHGHGLQGRLELTQPTAVRDFFVSEREAALVTTTTWLVNRWNRDDYGFLTLGHARTRHLRRPT
eukprot:2686488-Prymnesium_polylepis.1